MTVTDPKFEFGDFQTPHDTARAVVDCLVARGVEPRSIVEPTCGVGNFLLAATDRFRHVDRVFALDVNPEYAAETRRRVPSASVVAESFFDYDWPSLIASLPEPILIIGNPPWVTSSGLAARGGTNLPQKSNFHDHKGLDAKTGKSNFDIAEWMLIQLIKGAVSREVTVAMLLKTSVARKILRYAWENQAPLRRAAIYEIDAMKHFRVAAAACLFVCEMGPGPRTTMCDVHKGLGVLDVDRQIGWEDGSLVADADALAITRHLQSWLGPVNGRRWRSGVKHDCAKVMELRENDGRLINGLGEIVEIEDEYLFPLLKGSDVARDRPATRRMLVPQRRTGDDTKLLRNSAPKTWSYLESHGRYLDRRASSIYRNRPRFSVFGVGDYTFAPWKIAICGLYKTLDFRVVGPVDGRPIVFDDTSYLLSFNKEDEARRVAELLGSDNARTFFHAFVFWDNKRPITAELLNKLDIAKLSEDHPVFSETLFGT